MYVILLFLNKRAYFFKAFFFRFLSMWYEEQNQFVRAKTPQTFDRLVQELEDGDSVLFDSISLPKSNPNSQNQAPPPTQEKNKQKIPVRTSLKNINSNSELDNELCDDFIKDNDDDDIDDIDILTEMRDANNKPVDNRIDKKETLIQLKDKLRKVELEGKKKLEILRSKDQQILALQRELNEAQARKDGGDLAQSQSRSHESVEFYKGMYESALLDFENLKKSLKADGKIKRVSARAVKPITPKLNQ